MSVEDELYSLPPAEFTAARDEAVKQARAKGTKDRAKELGKLRKPSVSAWLANQLARQRPKELAKLLKLGEELRAATSSLDGARLRRLSGRQAELTEELVGEARELAGGQSISDAALRGLEQTLHAALADPEAAARLTEGRLTEALSSIGFPGFTGSSVSVDDDARAEAEAAERERVKRHTRRMEVERRVARAQATVDELRERLERATLELAEAQAELDE